MSAAMLQRGCASSTTTTRPVSDAVSRTVSVSSGEVVRRSTTVQPILPSASLSATWLEKFTMRPKVMIVTSSPSRVTLASPNGIV